MFLQPVVIAPLHPALSDNCQVDQYRCQSHPGNQHRELVERAHDGHKNTLHAHFDEWLFLKD
jgi:hypothetical protein